MRNHKKQNNYELEKYYSNIIKTTNSLLLELLNIDEFFASIINTEYISKIISLYAAEAIPYKIISFIIKNEILKGNTLILRETTRSTNALMKFVKAGWKYKGKVNIKKNIMRGVIELIQDFFIVIKSNSNLRLVANIIYIVANEMKIDGVVILAPLLISKLLIPIILRNDKQLVVSKILQYSVSEIVNDANNKVYSNEEIYIDYYYSHKEDLQYIQRLIEQETLYILNSDDSVMEIMVDTKYNPVKISKIWNGIYKKMPYEIYNMLPSCAYSISNFGIKLQEL